MSRDPTPAPTGVRSLRPRTPSEHAFLALSNGTFEVNGIALFNPGSISVTRCRYRGARIPVRGTSRRPPTQADCAPTAPAAKSNGRSGAFNRHSHDENPPDVPMESRMRWKSQVRFGGRRRGDHRPKDRHRRLAADPARPRHPSDVCIQVIAITRFGRCGSVIPPSAHRHRGDGADFPVRRIRPTFRANVSVRVRLCVEDCAFVARAPI